jgi:DNA-binding LacI/PurR family transcriptional regulator
MIPALTTARHNFAEIGRRCLALMLEQLDQPPRP